MKSIIVAGALAFGVLGVTSKADAQFVPFGTYYGYNPYAGVYYNQGNIYAPYVFRNVTNYYSPYTGLSGQRVYSADIFGNRAVQSYGVNPYFGGAYSRGYYVNPYTGLNYRYGYRW
jgi:hypothetical protein